MTQPREAGGDLSSRVELSECADCPLVELLPLLPGIGRCGWKIDNPPLWMEGRISEQSRYVRLRVWAHAPSHPCAAKAKADAA